MLPVVMVGARSSPQMPPEPGDRDIEPTSALDFWFWLFGGHSGRFLVAPPLLGLNASSGLGPSLLLL